VIAAWLSEIRTRGGSIAQAVSSPVADTARGFVRAAEEMWAAFARTWNSADHRERLAPLRTPVGVLNFVGCYKPGELYHRAISGSVIEPGRWAGYEAQVGRLGSALRPPHSHIFELGRILTAALYPTCGKYDPETDSFQFYTPADTLGAARHEAATERLPIGSRDLRAHLIETVGPKVAELLRAIRDASGFLRGVVNPLTAAGRALQRVVVDFHAEIRRRLEDAAA
jgi:hypothetical protein